MRQSVGAFKAASGAALGKRLAAACLLLSAQGCATLLGKPDPDVVAQQGEELRLAQARASDLQSEVAKLSAENAELKTKVADLEAKSMKLAAGATQPPAAKAGSDSLLKDGPPSTLAANDARPSTAPPAPVVAAPNADVANNGDPVPVDNSPRLVQPSFASTETIFENEAASPEIKLTSVLWGVHLASYKHPDDASSGWAKLQRENPDELGLLEPRIERVNVEGKGEYLRLVGGGFSSREKAKALCDRLQGKGVFCRIATFGGDRLSMLDVGALR